MTATLKLSVMALFAGMLFLFPVKNSFSTTVALPRQDSSAHRVAPKKAIVPRKAQSNNKEMYYKGGPLYLLDVSDSSSNR